MANSVDDLSIVLLPLADLFPPQQISATTNGSGVQVEEVGSGLMTADLHVGAAVGLTSLVVTLQASVDNGVSGWVNVNDQNGNQVTFPMVTAGSQAPSRVSFHMPTATGTNPAYSWIRAVATLTGTSIFMQVGLEVTSKMGGFGVGYQNAPPTIN